MPSGIFVISFSEESISLDFSIFHTSDVTEEDIRDIFSGMEIETRTIQYFSTSSIKILYYAIAENEEKSLLGVVLRLKEAQDFFETPLIEEAELLLQKDRDENFSINLKATYQRIVQKAVKNIEERIAETDKKREEKHLNVKNLEEELKEFYNEEKELLAKLEREGETSSIIEKIEAVIAKQKQLEELIRMKKNLKTPKELPKEKYSDLRNELIELQELYTQINGFKVVQPPIGPEKAIKKEIGEKGLEPTEEATSSSEISALMKRLQTLSTKQLTSQNYSFSSVSSTALESETTTMHNETIKPFTETPSSKISSVLESESKEARLSRILTEKVGEAKSVILEYLFWLKKPRTITEISHDLEIPAEKIIKTAEDLLKNGYVCQLTKKNVKEVYLTVCPSCPLQSKCRKERPINWNQILYKT